MALIANTHRDPKARPRPFTAEDFLLRFRSSERRQTWQQQKAMAMMIVAAYNHAEAKGEVAA